MSWSVIRWSLRSSVFLALLLFHCPLLRAQGTGIALKPPLGWNTWYGYLCKVTDSDVRAQADWMVQNGMKAVGYEYVNIDDCWQGQRDAQGVIHSNGNFPDMKALGDYIHGKGLKFGVYSSPGPKTCAGYEGSYGHEEEDARTYAAWGVDFLKYDWCSGGHVYQPSEMLGAYYYYVKLRRSVSFANYAATIRTLVGPGKQQALDLTTRLRQGPPRSFFCCATFPRSGKHALT